MRLLSIACAIAIAGSAARAERIGVAAASGAGQRGALTSAIAAAIGTGGVIEDAPGEARAAVMAGAVPVATLERFRRVREQIDEAWRAFLRVQVEFAASRLASARTAAEQLVAVPGGAALYADASLRLGAVLAHLGRAGEAQASLALALALDPDRPITLAEFSPDVVAAVDAVRAQTRPVRAVRITSEPAGAVINVDGRDVGRAPLTVDLSRGHHVVVARLPLYETRALAFGESSGEVEVVLDRDVAWTRLAEGAVIGMADDRAHELVDATLRYADLDEVVLVADAQQRGGPALLVQRCASAPVKCTAVVEIGYGDPSGLAAAAREAWQAVRTAELRYPPSVFGDARAGGTQGDDRCKLCRSPWLWGGVSAAAVIGTIVILAVVTASQPPPIVTTDPTRY